MLVAAVGRHTRVLLRLAAALALAFACQRLVMSFDHKDFLKGSAPRAHQDVLWLQAFLAFFAAAALGALSAPLMNEDPETRRLLAAVAAVLAAGARLLFAVPGLAQYDFSS